MVYVLLEGSVWPSLVQVTVVAGEPVDVQFRVNIEEDDLSMTCNDETEGGASKMNKAEPLITYFWNYVQLLNSKHEFYMKIHVQD